MRLLFITVVLSLYSNFCFGSDINFERGIEAHTRGDYASAHKFWEKSAFSGNNMASVNIGVAYLKGQGVTQNYIEAMRWFKAAAVKGELHSKHLIGEMYFKGQSVTTNKLTARMWFGISLAQGNMLSKSFCNEIDATLSESEKQQVKQVVDQCILNSFVGCHF